MAFDIGAGLSAAGGAIAATAGAMNLESQKAELEMEKVKLADQLLGAREEKGRAFTTSERLSTQQFTSGENVENRKNAVAIANIGADAAVKSAGIHAGGAVAAATINASASRDIHAATLAQNKPLIDVEVLTKSITNASATMIQDARKELAAARESGDQAKIQAAQQKEYDASYSSDKQVQQVSLYQAQAKIAEQALSQAQSRLAQLSTPDKLMMPENKPQIEMLTKQVKDLADQYSIAVKQANDALKQLPAYTPPSGAGAGAPPLSQLIKPLQGPAVTGTPAPSLIGPGGASSQVQ